MQSPDKIAAAVNAHCKALRLLGQIDTDIGHIAESLGLTPEEVAGAFENFRVSGSYVSKSTKRQCLTIRSDFYPIINFGKPR